MKGNLMKVVTLNGLPYCFRCTVSLVVDLFNGQSSALANMPKMIDLEEDSTDDLLCERCNTDLY
ncbi:hypothetical protein LCGC14_0729680 [marine sediment metagenome]|uniref:Uncharacterized protein n=1 Tax=marine sediment metagenome TaxID=412755 RepID=A0A0F9SVB1_9ZZZZ